MLTYQYESTGWWFVCVDDIRFLFAVYVLAITSAGCVYEAIILSFYLSFFYSFFWKRKKKIENKLSSSLCILMSMWPFKSSTILSLWKKCLLFISNAMNLCLCSLNLIIHTKAVFDWHSDMVKWLNEPTPISKLAHLLTSRIRPIRKCLYRGFLSHSIVLECEHNDQTIKQVMISNQLWKASFKIDNQIVCTPNNTHAHTTKLSNYLQMSSK